MADSRDNKTEAERLEIMFGRIGDEWWIKDPSGNRQHIMEVARSWGAIMEELDPIEVGEDDYECLQRAEFSDGSAMLFFEDRWEVGWEPKVHEDDSMLDEDNDHWMLREERSCR